LFNPDNWNPPDGWSETPIGSDIYDLLNPSPYLNDSAKPYEGDMPDDNPDNYKPGERPGDKINKEDGSIWSPDKGGHADSK